MSKEYKLIFLQFGNSNAMHETVLNYESKTTKTKFTLKTPGVVLINSIGDTHFKARISMNPLKIEVSICHKV